MSFLTKEALQEKLAAEKTSGQDHTKSASEGRFFTFLPIPEIDKGVSAGQGQLGLFDAPTIDHDRGQAYLSDIERYVVDPATARQISTSPANGSQGRVGITTARTMALLTKSFRKWSGPSLRPCSSLRRSIRIQSMTPP